ncbi:MAG: hypothetical protein A3G71_06980 [Gammaproteobacteria bacterium RIFCSPLOWO2_12_FULL_38_14]|nr:MAG: hypothetical protein A3G71_06980 [Gammaproteobacteria bacterium RIFCSPLOWO2_12_FULL_38_14]
MTSLSSACHLFVKYAGLISFLNIDTLGREIMLTAFPDLRPDKNLQEFIYDESTSSKTWQRSQAYCVEIKI